MSNAYIFSRRTAIAAVAVALAASAFGAEVSAKELKIGFVGVTSGPAAAWGTSNVRSMQTRAAWINETGGVKIGGDTYTIKILTFDDKTFRGRQWHRKTGL